MSKSRPFSIHLLKQGYDSSNSLKEEHSLENNVLASSLPSGATLCLLNNAPYTPWWANYFGISKNISQVSKGALIFLPVDGRCFVISFGHVHHNLKEDSYEYDFGLRVTLNAVDPKKLKSTDILEPSAARRRTTQPSVACEITFFDFDRDSNILKRLTGAVKKEYSDLFRQATGASSLRISSKVASNELPQVCSKLLALYKSNEYETIFPGIKNIEPIKDPSLIRRLDEKLLSAFHQHDENIALSVPDILNYIENVFVSFLGCGKQMLFSDASIENYFEQLSENNYQIHEINVDTLKSHRLAVTDENESPKDTYSIYKCLIFDTTLDEDGECFSLCEGCWYKADSSYLKKIHQELDAYYEEQDLPEYNHKTEGEYNLYVAKNNPSIICLDASNTSPSGQTQIEPCDLLYYNDKKSIFYHVKVSTRSSSLSHLFNQGMNSIEIIKSDKMAKDKFIELIKKSSNNFIEELCSCVEQNQFKIVYAIVTYKDKSHKSYNLPLFSRISLRRSIKSLELWNVTPVFCFIKNCTEKEASKPKQRKKKS